MSVFLDLHIQDFVNSYSIMNNRYAGWSSLISRSSIIRNTAIARYSSSQTTQLARLSVATLPDAEWLIVELWIPQEQGQGTEHRFDCLRMLSTNTHASLDVETTAEGKVILQLRTRHPGLINVCFILTNSAAPTLNPWLLATCAAVSSSPQNLS